MRNMKISLVTIRVPGNPMYDGVTERWIDTYIKHKPTIQHDLIVVDSDQAGHPGRHGEHATRFMVYNGGGWDCGIWLMAANVIQSDLLICCNTSTYFWKDGWMDRFVAEFEKHGAALYGSMSSYELAPHMRTPCYVFPPRLMHGYPILIDSRPKTLHI